ncbi:uncharacterized protein CIMG_13358 [Coccidioides immitis RS]|uniref:Uncharacterized protein n=1 Tax=Coccidioides immitis (strain RS) TaxID=246410 RepID=A0A0D8JUY7_COCIM|nr:uncharacterized protein CIMG_13358 [Coccidioides immitis RS]KJF60969.1 hypothetical protein CIMG_13358 [Coccidioides immitis RS]
MPVTQHCSLYPFELRLLSKQFVSSTAGIESQLDKCHRATWCQLARLVFLVYTGQDTLPTDAISPGAEMMMMMKTCLPARTTKASHDTKEPVESLALDIG